MSSRSDNVLAIGYASLAKSRLVIFRFEQ
jgi:hypothetical protein